jgi:hypothetical protein
MRTAEWPKASYNSMPEEQVITEILALPDNTGLEPSCAQREKEQKKIRGRKISFRICITTD